VVDFRRNKDGIPAKVERIEYDPNRTAHIALVCYADGERRYIIAPRGLEVGASLMSGAEAPIRPATRCRSATSRWARPSTASSCKPGKGAQIARSAGTSATLLAREGTYAQVRMRSGEVRKIHIECRATIGEVANEEHSLRQSRQGRCEALDGHPPDRSRRGDEPGRPPARWWRRPHRRRPPCRRSRGVT
jgi:large subunit ribosomal protein L2